MGGQRSHLASYLISPSSDFENIPHTIDQFNKTTCRARFSVTLLQVPIHRGGGSKRSQVQNIDICLIQLLFNDQNCTGGNGVVNLISSAY